ncbi:MAG: NAD(P)/FAD-dependent oxidoreductase [Syntrophothermus sp.]
MGTRSLQLRLPTSYSEGELRQKIARELSIRDFTYQIDSKSLDARKKKDIFWQLRVVVHSPEIREFEAVPASELIIPFKKQNKTIVITGSGPAGFFAGYVLQKSGFSTIILERGAEVGKRASGIRNFEKTGIFDTLSNYSFGEGGAGTFSDGKLTSRSKHISPERSFILKCYAEHGAPEEILYMAHPHVGSDNLKKIVRNLREDYQQSGGRILFEKQTEDIISDGTTIHGVISGKDSFAGDYFIFAPGHSAYETYRMLMNRGVQFRTKNFAIGSRAEHEQRIINQAQWGVEHLQGVKAAEYRLTSAGDGHHPVYSFCMCPGGMVVPAATYAHQNIVNGMSNYQRNERFANAACVAGIHPDELAGKKVTALEALDRLEALEQSFYDFSGGYQAPFCTIDDFLKGKDPKKIPDSSYPLGLKPAPLWNMLPPKIVVAMREGLQDFNRKLKGYEKGILLGLESKTSSPVQVLREPDGACTGFENLFLVGEGSGYAGGIISSAADGIKTAMKIIQKSS